MIAVGCSLILFLKLLFLYRCKNTPDKKEYKVDIKPAIKKEDAHRSILNVSSSFDNSNSQSFSRVEEEGSFATISHSSFK